VADFGVVRRKPATGLWDCGFSLTNRRTESLLPFCGCLSRQPGGTTGRVRPMGARLWGQAAADCWAYILVPSRF